VNATKNIEPLILRPELRINECTWLGFSQKNRDNFKNLGGYINQGFC
jgi:hypothetical protein